MKSKLFIAKQTISNLSESHSRQIVTTIMDTRNIVTTIMDTRSVETL